MRILALLLPALIPSWRFFKTVAPSPRIEVRIAGAWRELPPPDMPLTPLCILARLFWNPHWNTHLFSITLSERLAETADAGAEAMLRTYIADRLGGKAPPFRLIFIYREGDQIIREELYRSSAA